MPREPFAALLRIALRLLASRAAGGGALLVALLGRLRVALRLVALGLRLLHAGVLGIALLVVALLLRDLVGGLGLGLLRLALGLRLVGGVLGVELGLRDLLLAFRLGHADVLGVGLQAVALGFVDLGRPRSTK